MKIQQKYVWTSENTYSPINYIHLDLLDYCFMVMSILIITGGLIN